MQHTGRLKVLAITAPRPTRIWPFRAQALDLGSMSCDGLAILVGYSLGLVDQDGDLRASGQSGT